ncbi:MAG: alpha/beta hydrolase [Chloroflexi bacterium]|nr:alpha/beta hydrolase [Chloroflexota bacterium]
MSIVQKSLALAALGASALTADGILLGRKRFREWETLACEDADDGEFLTLSDGAQMHYVARGNHGAPVILIHGLMSSTHEWAKNMDALAAIHRVWAIDLVGFGFSSRVTAPTYSLKYYARSVQEFLDAQGIARANLVGHSLGGAVALQFAHDYAAHVEKLVLIDSAAYIFGWFRAARLAARVPHLPRAVCRMMLSNPRVHRSALRNALGDPVRLDEGMLAARMRASRVKGTLDALLAMMASPHASDLPEGLNAIAAPALVLWGDKDLVLPLRHGERLARDLPNAELIILEGAGHVPNEEFPDVVNTLMLDFLNKEPSIGLEKTERKPVG